MFPRRKITYLRSAQCSPVSVILLVRDMSVVSNQRSKRLINNFTHFVHIGYDINDPYSII